MRELFGIHIPARNIHFWTTVPSHGGHMRWNGNLTESLFRCRTARITNARLFKISHKYLFSITSEKIHKERKLMLSHPTNTQILDSPALDTTLNTILYKRLLPQIRAWSSTSQTINVLYEAKAFCMDITSAFIFGLSSSTNFILDPIQKSLVIPAFEINTTRLIWETESPLMTKIFGFVGRNFGKKKREYLQGLKKFEKEVMWECKAAKENMTSSSKSGVEDNTTVYTQFRKKLEENPNIKREDINGICAAEIWDLLKAGHEGPGITLSYLMAELSCHPTAQALLVKELHTLKPTGTRKLPPAREITKLPYLDAVLRETMRLYPSALGPFPRVVPAKNLDGEDVRVCLGGYEDIPEGTIVSASAYSLHLNPEVFTNPEEWRPERWVDGRVSRGELVKWWWAFGSGSRVCWGNHLAFRMMKAFVVAVYSEFDPDLVEPVGEQIDGMLGSPGDNKVLMRFYPAVR